MSDLESTPTDDTPHRTLPAAALEVFRTNIANHVAAIGAAARDLQAAVSDCDASPDSAVTAIPIVYVRLSPLSATTLDDTTIHMPTYKAECPVGTVPIIFEYVGGTYGDGETLWVQETDCL